MYLDGHNGETVPTMRKGETLWVVDKFRAFGRTEHEISRKVTTIHKSGAVIKDKETGQRSDKNGVEMLRETLRRVHGEVRFPEGNGIRSKGGKARAQSIRQKRMPINQARVHYFNQKISRSQAVKLCGPGWSPTTLYNTFGPSGRPSGPFTPKQQ